MNEIIEKIIDLINNDDINGLSKLLTLLDSDEYDDLVLKEKLIKILNTFIDLQLTYTKKRFTYTFIKDIYYEKKEIMQDAYDKYLELIMFYNFLQEKLSLITEKNNKNQFFNFKMEMLKAIQKFRKSEKKLQEIELDYLEFSDDFLRQKQQIIDELKGLLVKTR